MWVLFPWLFRKDNKYYNEVFKLLSYFPKIPYFLYVFRIIVIYSNCFFLFLHIYSSIINKRFLHFIICVQSKKKFMSVLLKRALFSWAQIQLTIRKNLLKLIIAFSFHLEYITNTATQKKSRGIKNSTIIKITSFPGPNRFRAHRRPLLGLWGTRCNPRHSDHGQGNRQRLPTGRRGHNPSHRSVPHGGPALQYLRREPTRLHGGEDCWDITRSPLQKKKYIFTMRSYYHNLLM